MNDMEKKQHEAMTTAIVNAKPKIGELTDEELEAVAGGRLLTGTFYVSQCVLCGWTAAFNNEWASDMENAVRDHGIKNPGCPAEFEVFKFEN